jgi:hypothetical protein
MTVLSLGLGFRVCVRCARGLAQADPFVAQDKLKFSHYTRKSAGMKASATKRQGSRTRRALQLLVFGVDAEGAGFVEGGVEGFGFFDEDFAELFFLREGDGLELDHFEDG